MMFVVVTASFLLILAPAQGQINNQQDLDNLANSLEITWDVITNTKEVERFEVEVTLHNPSSSRITLINDAWRLHLACIYMIEPDFLLPYGHASVVLPGQQFSVTHVHGSNFYFAPTRQFTDLPPGSSKKIKFKVLYWSVARTDTMPNWYLTYTSLQPRVVSSTGGESLSFVGDRTRVEQVKRYDFDLYMPWTPQDRFERYHSEEAQPADPAPRLVPKPLESRVSGNAEVPREVAIDQTWIIIHPSSLANEAQYLRDSLSIRLVTGASTTPSTGTETKAIVLETGPVTFSDAQKQRALEDSEEAYTLTVNVDTPRIGITGRGASGVFYGVVSLISLMGGTTRVPEYTLTDAPRFEYRGFMLDIVRNFHSAREISTLIEVMAMYKLNKLHLHLTDDEGWRLQIAALPELTQIGATQCYDMLETRCLLTELGARPEGNPRYLSAEEYRALIDLAKRRHVTIIPEIDMPGHARAAIKAMQVRMSRMPHAPIDQQMWLTERGDPSRYLSTQMYFDNALNPCLASAYNFIDIVMTELVRLHDEAGQPLQTFHYGGDEVAKGAWVNSTACQTLRSNGSLAEGPVKEYFAQRVAEMARRRGLSLSAWEDGVLGRQNTPFDKSQISGNDVFAYTWSDVWDWNMSARTYNLANAGYKVVMTHATHLYFDHPQEPDPEERGYYWATRYTDMKKTFSYNAARVYDNIKVRLSGKPISAEEKCPKPTSCPPLTKPENIVGLQSTLFSETQRTDEQVQGQVFPRMLAFAERAWRKADWEEMPEGPEKERELEADWSEFARAVSDREIARLQAQRIQYRIPPPGARLREDGELEVTTELPGFDVQYSVDSGLTWRSVTPGLYLPQQYDRIQLRTSSKDGNRFSRTVTMRLDATLPQATQNTLEYIGRQLQVNLTVVDNSNKYGDDFFLGRLTLKNAGQREIPAGNWRIYFSTLKMLEPEVLLRDRTFINSDLALYLEHVQGPLVSLGPTADFTGLQPGQEIVMNFKGEGSSVSADDFLPNWYVSAPGLNPHDIVSTAEGAAFVSPFTTARAYTRTRDDQYAPWSPDARFQINAAWAGEDDEDDDEPSLPPVLPTPANFEPSSDQVLNLLEGSWAVVASTQTSSIFRDWMLRFFPDIQLANQRTAPGDRYIRFRQGDISESSSPEAYSIRVNAGARTVEVTSRSDAGAFRAVITLVQLALKTFPNKPNGTLYDCSIVDYPRFNHRSLYLDTARFFVPKDSVLRLLDTMALYKMNQLHFHLSDDEGWRLEIPTMPELTEIGSKRCRGGNEQDCLLDTLGSGDPEKQQADQFYTLPEYVEILRHAQRLHIEVIPEFDMPGHSRAAVRSMLARYHRFADNGQNTQGSRYLLHEVHDPTRYSTPQYYTDNVVNPCLQSTFTFIRDLYAALSAIYLSAGFSLPGLHLGGEEVPADPWTNSTACQAWLQQDQHLQTHFISAAALQFSDATLRVWEDLLFDNQGLRVPISKSQFQNPDVVTDVYQSVPEWGSMWRAYTLANAGYKVMLAPASHVFFDHPQEPDPVEGSNVWAARYIDTFKTFSFMPSRYYDNFKTRMSGEDITRDFVCQQSNSSCPRLQVPENIIGLKGVMKTLRVRSLEELDFHLYPRLLALAERAWRKAPWEDVTQEDQWEAQLFSDWTRFATGLAQNDLPVLDKMGVAYRLPPPGVRVQDDRLLANTDFPGLEVQYHIEGEMPGSSWLELTPTTKFAAGHHVLLRTVSPDGNRASRTVRVPTGRGRATAADKGNGPDGASGLSGCRLSVLLAAMLVCVVTCSRRL